MVQKLIQAPRSIWYLDSYASQHLTNNKDLFTIKLQFKSLDFTTAGGQVLRTKRIEKVAIPLVDGISIELHDVAYTPDCNANLIFLSQLHDNNIQYIDILKAMTLIQSERPVTSARRN